MWTTVAKGPAAVEAAVKQLLPPCQVQCPINEDIQRTNVLISLLPDDPALAKQGIIQIGDYLYEKNPFFAVCGYVCGLCELECNYQSKGGSIKRRLLKRFLADTYIDYLDQKEELDLIKHKENIAVVGGGPSGLMAAWHLSKRGYRVTIFEASDRLGGALWLIPRYRLPEKVLASTCENIVRLAGIDVKYNAEMGNGKLSLEKLQHEGYSAVFMAKGTPQPRALTFMGAEVEGGDLSGIEYGHTFLYEVSHGNISPNYFKGKKVVVIGGGNVAFDAARTAKRLGGDTALVCLECEDKKSKDGIPADHEEIRGAWQEGIRTIYSRGVSKIFGAGNNVSGIECPKCTQVFDDAGFNPKFDLSDTIKLDADLLIVTVGQGADRAALQKDNLLDERGRIAVDPITMQSLNREWVFIGGDLRRIGFMVDAMRDGIEAAESIERYLRGLDVREGRKWTLESQDIPLRRYYLGEPEIEWTPPEKRMHFELFEHGFTLPQAVHEARRCLTCGPCLSCKACVSVGIQNSLSEVEVNADRCSGCGVCTSICYYGAAQSKQVEGKRKSFTDTFKCKSCGMCVVACPSGARELVGDPMHARINEVYANLSGAIGG